MQKYEYKVAYKDINELQDEIDKMSNEGWRLVTVSCDALNEFYTMFFERPLEITK